MEIKIEKLDDFGRGICYIDNKVTFVPNTIPNDLVEIKITKEFKNYNEGKLINILIPSKKRIEPKCPYFSKCGGCVLQNMNYKDTLEYKKEKVINIFKKNKLEINPIVIENANYYNYRNKISLKVIDKKIGYYEPKSHSIVEIDSCLVASNSINKVIPFIKKMGINNGLVTIRCNKNDEVLIIIESKDKLNIDVDSIKENIKLVGIVINNKLFYGEDFLYENINGMFYKISYDSFFQVNPYIASKIFDIIKENINSNETVLDIYSGVGTLSLTASTVAKKVIGIEIVENAVLNAIHNAKINKINNVDFLLNDATKAITKLNLSFDKVIVDPPRAGLTKTVIDTIKKIKPKEIIYVSCDPQTLVRDIKLLSDLYTINKFYIADMFSFSYHVESICILKINNI